MSFIFFGCSSLTFLPDISFWKCKKIRYLEYMFYGCSSLISLPDLSKWKLKKDKIINNIFDDCLSLISLPKLYILEQSAPKNCFSLLNLPKESKRKQKDMLNHYAIYNDNENDINPIIDKNKDEYINKFMHILNDEEEEEDDNEDELYKYKDKLTYDIYD